MRPRRATAGSLEDPAEPVCDKLSLLPLRRSPKAVLVAAVQQDMHGPTPTRSLPTSAEKSRPAEARSSATRGSSAPSPRACVEPSENMLLTARLVITHS